MRLWSLHPKYLDQKGLCGLWREALLAQSVLLKGEYSLSDMGKIKTPYWNHPQLNRFKISNSLDYIGWYLINIYEEGYKRKYNFDKAKIIKPNYTGLEYLQVTAGQLIYEFNHLQDKLLIRCEEKYQDNCNLLHEFNNIKINPIFNVIEGIVESWEKIK